MSIDSNRDADTQSTHARDLDRAARFIVWALRHDPKAAGIVLDAKGWTTVSSLLSVTRVGKGRLRPEGLWAIVASDNKQRLELSPNRQQIRAAQGHSVEVDLGDLVLVPDRPLFHGTSSAAIDSIRREGLRPGSRRHVHLSVDIPTALAVGARHGSPVALPLLVDRMILDRVEFLQASNGVWLCQRVEPHYIDWGLLVWGTQE